ncbi:hypothetical protein LIER_00198 [Lithospermum erythrorhizon]|uniref:Uncharacterized protein n=1 Tax=Lithospermum erythrorhizon TaxID=34254 RepID=A0AAV3NGJ6_LITER
MLYVVQRTCKDVQDAKRTNTLSSGGNSKINEITGKSKVEDTEISSITCRNYSSRCTILASSDPGPNKYSFIVVPTQSLDRKTSLTCPQIDIKDLDMSSTFPSGSLKFREPLILGEPITDGESSGDSIIHRSHKRPHFLPLSSVNCSTNDGSNWKVLPLNSCCRNPSISIEYPLGLSRWPDAASSAYRYINVVDDCKALQRNSKRKTSRSRGKCNDLSRICSSPELNGENGISRTEDDRIKDMCTVSISMPHLQEPDSRINQNAITNDSGVQDFVICTFMVDTSENGLLDDGSSSSMYNRSVTYPEFCKSLLPDSSSHISNDCQMKKTIIRQAIDGDRISCSLEKKEYQSRKLPLNSSVKRHNSLGNLNMNYGKDNTHSIWRKVQRNDADVQNCKSNSQSTNLVPSHHKHHSFPDSCLLSKHEYAHMPQLKASKKPKKRKSSRSKKDLHSTCKVESHATKGCSSVCSSNDMKIISLSSSRQNLAGCESRSFSRKNSGAIYQAKKVELMAYKPLHKPEAVIPVLLSESPNCIDPVVVLDVTERQYDLPPQQCSFHDTTDVHKEDSFIDDNMKMTEELPATDYCKEKMHSTVLAEKRVNLGVNNSRESNLGQSSLPLEALKLDDGSLHREGITWQKSFCSPRLAPYPDKVDQSLAIMAEDEISIKKSEMTDTSTPKFSCNNTATNGLTCEFKNPVLFNSASAMVNVFQAVNDAYRVQLASEAIQSITGSPIAEFEEFVYSASPVLYGAWDINNCNECLPLHAFGEPLCQHEKPNLSLGNIWRWYEKHGACGMEVRAKDREHAVRFGMDQFEFNAYFVPYLSAVQLFRKCKAHLNGDTYVYSRGTDSNECSSTDVLASVIRKLVPQPCSVNLSTFSKKSHVPHKEVSFASINNNIDDEQSDSKFTDGVDLLFEYFEYDQPQQRRPLLEMIKELSSGHIPSKSRLFGDPSSLESLSLNDLHPDSWYSVAWYPIYRIPEGKLRAAFLTYHSFGHLVRRRPKHGSHSVDVSIVSPVVGLQSYSAQGECWFNPRQPTEHKKNGVMDLDSSHVLKERIRTLEHTASVMARATVTTGSQTFVNRQPDYEFFLSRRR